MGVIKTICNAAAERRVALMLDLDGAVIKRRPGVHDPVAPDLDLEDSLISLMRQGCPVAINTGRPAKFIENIFPNIHASAPHLPFWVSTETGAHITGPDQNIIFRRAVPDIDHLRQVFSQAASGHPGTFIEMHKMCAITISLAAASSKLKAYSHMLTVCNDEAAQTEGINIIHVYKPDDAYIEIVPAGVHKGTATEHILAHPDFHDRLVICFGDSNADENMMAVVNNRNNGHIFGCSIGVGPQAPDIAHKRLGNHMESQKLISTLAGLANQDLSQKQAMRQLSL